jgi:uncharacterized membrane protein
MDFYLMLLRIVHIIGGVFWAGSAFMLVQFVAPAVTLAGPEGGKFMQRLVLGTRLSVVTGTAAGLTVLTGLLLYWRASGGLRGEWISTGTGVMFTIGGLAGLIALFTGAATSANSRKLAELGQGLQGPPSPEQAAEIARLQNRLSNLGAATAILLLAALIAMATAQYVFF